MDFTTSGFDQFEALNKVENFDITLKQKGRKKETAISGWDRDIKELKGITKQLKKTLCCSGNVVKLEKDDDKKDQEPELVIVLFGDHRDEVTKFMVEKLDIKEDNIIIHGA